MTTNASALPALPTTNTDMRKVSERMNVLIRWFNRPDLFVPSYGADSGSATAYATSQSTDIKVYEVGQIYVFKAANANTATAPTYNVQGIGAGTITYPDGSALVPSDIAANGFYPVICTSTTPTFQLWSGPKNRLLQVVSVETGALNTGTTTFSIADSVPANTNGDQYMSLAITPKSSTSTLIIRAVGNFGTSGAPATFSMGLFQDSGACLAAVGVTTQTAALMGPLTLRHMMTSGTTSATTFKIRAGANVAGTTTFNGFSGGRIYGGVMSSSILIQEVLP